MKECDKRKNHKSNSKKAHKQRTDGRT